MRLLFVGTNRGPGGAESHFVALSGAMAAAGHEVAAVVAPDDFLWRTLAARGNVRLFAGEFRTKLDRSAMAAVRRAARAVRPQWIVGAFELDYWGTALVAAERRVPLALFRHHAALKRSTVRVLPRLVHRFVLPSEFLRRWAVARGIPHRRTAALPNPVDAPAFRPDAAVRAAQRAALGFGEEDVVVGFAGRFEHNKGVDVLAASLAAAMQQHAALRALWIGEGRLDGAVNASIAASGFATRHVRRSWADDPSAYYQAMDMLAFPSVGPEAFGRVSVEAQASGVPVLASATGGVAETMDVGATGDLVVPGDTSAWSDAIVALARDGARRAAMAAAGPPFVARTFDAPVIAAEFARILAAAAPRHARP